MREAGYHCAPGDHVAFGAHVLEYGIGGYPVIVFGVEGDEGVEEERVGGELGIGEFGVEEFAEVELAGANGGFEEEGEGGEVKGEVLLGHEIEGRDCLAEVAHIGFMDQAVLQVLKIGIF